MILIRLYFSTFTQVHQCKDTRDTELQLLFAESVCLDSLSHDESTAILITCRVQLMSND